MRDRRLQGIKAIIQRQQGVASKGDDHRLAGPAQNRGTRPLWRSLAVFDTRPFAPLCDRLGVDAVCPALFAIVICVIG